MVELQILSRVLKERNTSILTLNGITEEYFITYPSEYNYIMDHVNKYGNVPDKETFLFNFPEFSIIDVAESDKYLVDTLNEEHLYSMTVPVVNKIAELLQTDSRSAVEYLQSQLPLLTVRSSVMGTDIISKAEQRLEVYKSRKNDKSAFVIPTGFKELDEITGGWQRGEELVVIFARTGQGKSWLLIKSLEHAWKMGKRVGLIEPEMSAIKTGYRFDTLTSNISNTALNRGDEIKDYEAYIKDIKTKDTPFYVVHPKEFNRKVTVSKLRSFVQSNKLELLGIDGIGYLTDERKQRGDSRTISLTNISEDLMDLSIELSIPIIVVCQSNREGAKDDDAPHIENIRDSDGIAYNSSVIIAARQKGPGIELAVRKNRNGVDGDKLLYLWDIDKGVFEYIPNSEESESGLRNDEEHIERIKKEFNDGTEVF